MVSPSTDDRRLQKVTYSLPVDLVEDVREVVRNGAAPSYSAFVERALKSGVLRAREAQLAREFAEAGSDELFLDDVERALRDLGAPGRGREG